MAVDNELGEGLRTWHKSRSLGESWTHARRGLVYAFRTERNMRVQVAIYLLAVLVGVVLGFNHVKLAVLVLTATVILILEMVNTALENLSNIIEPRYHTNVRQLKDVVAGAVLLAALAAAAVGVLLYGPPLLELLY